jgi:hypothetical protein
MNDSATQPTPHPLRHARKWPAVVGVSVAMALAGGAIYFLLQAKPSLIPARIQELATTTPTLFYPTKLPDGVTFATDESVRSDGVTSYVLVTHGKKIVVTAQSRPESVVFDDFYNRILTNKADVFSNQGRAVIGSAGGKTIGSLVTANTWVLISAPGDVDSQTITLVVSRLVPVKPLP